MADDAGQDDMRLICPSCGAQYEVDESVIPDAGRDVQCSNCGHAWFQRSAAQLKAEEEHRADLSRQAEAATQPAVESSPAPEHAPEPEPVQDRAPASEPGKPVFEAEAEKLEEPRADDAEEDGEPRPAEIDEAPDDAFAEAGDPDAEAPEAAELEEDEDDEQAVPAPPVPERVRRELDDSVRDVLREEAEREVRARVAEGQPVETQTEMGLAAAIGAARATTVTPQEAVRDRVARLRGDDDELDDEALVSRASRRELLPDIEEINSTLRATSDRGDEPASVDAPETLRRRRSGFRLGFSTALILALVALVVYLLAPTLSQSVPALEPALSGYVATVEAGRAWLDETMKSLTASLNGEVGN